MTLRLTPKRAKILAVLKKHHGTLSAADIHAKLPEMDLVTIYRNLDLFVQEKLIKQIRFGTTEAQYEYQHEPHHHAVCSSCEKVIHFTAPDKKIQKLLDLHGFDVDDMDVTLHGTCSSHSKER